jgi:hypothetical protein
LAFKESRPFKQLSDISFEDIARKRIESGVDSLSNLFSLSNTLLDTLKAALPSLPKDYQTEFSRDLRNQIEESSVQGIFVYLESKDIGKRGLHADSTRLSNREDSIKNPANYRSRRDAWQPDSGWAAYFPKGSRKFTSPEMRRNIRTYYEWFKKADSLGSKENWLGPVFDDNAKSRVIYRVLPIEFDEQKGFILISHSTSWLYIYLQQIGISCYGSPYILDEAGSFIVTSTNETRLRRTNEPSTEIVFKIPNTQFSVGVSVYAGDSQESNSYQSAMRHIFFRILAFSVISILLFLFGIKIIFKPLSGIVYVLIPICMLCAIVLSITVYHRYPGLSSSRMQASDYDEIPYSERDKQALKENGVDFKWNPALVIDQKAVNFFVKRYQNRSDSLYGSQAKILPTGVLINNILFTGSNVVMATGFVWQKFLKADEQYPRQVSREYLYDTYRNKGIDFFGAQSEGAYGGSFELVDSLETTMNGHKAILMRWSFVVEVEHIPSYGLYPFGIYNMSFVLKGKNRDDNTMLIPDVTAYTSMFPIDKPGLDDRLGIIGWDILQSSYSYRFNRNQSNMGNVNSQSKAPDIRLNIFLSSRFLDVLVSKLLSVMVIITLLFVLISIRDKDNILDTVLGCSGLFFALVLDHVNLRGNVQSTDIMYLEFIYLTAYGFLLITILSSVYLKKIDEANMVRLNTSMRNYFWSLFFGIMAVATMWRFY